jgi:predicted regulator of Ras-like GTPase activity (Roadblock/LC7/MglB family)
MFTSELESLCAEVPGCQGAVVMSFDGISVAQHACGSDLDMETILIELSGALRQTMQALSGEAGDDLQEVVITSKQKCLLVRLLRDEYFVALFLAPESLVGKGRYALRLHSLPLIQELS